MRFECLALAACAAIATVPANAEPRHYAFGRPPTPAEIAAEDIDVRADGQGLPPGEGSVAQGHDIFAQTCAPCHGDKGQGLLADRLAGGFGTLKDRNPVRTVGSYWPYATTAVTTTFAGRCRSMRRSR